MNFDLSRFSYQIISGRSFRHPDESRYRNEISDAWYELWNEVYKKKSDSGFRLHADEFLRQDLVTCIRYDQKVAALHLYSFFDLACSASLKSHYFEFFGPSYIKALEERGVRTVMSMEFLTVFPDFRKHLVGVSLASTISLIGTWVFREVGVDAIIAPARKDVKVHDVAYDIGFDCIEADTIQRGFPCDLIACFQGRQKPSEMPEVNALAGHLWPRAEILPSAESYFQRSFQSKKLGVAKAA